MQPGERSSVVGRGSNPDGTHYHTHFPRARIRVDVWVRHRLRAHPALDATMVRRSVQHSNIDTAVLVSGPVFRRAERCRSERLGCVRLGRTIFPGTVALLSDRCSTMQGF